VQQVFLKKMLGTWYLVPPLFHDRSDSNTFGSAMSAKAGQNFKILFSVSLSKILFILCFAFFSKTSNVRIYELEIFKL